jgi:hypothetical protein
VSRNAEFDRLDDRPIDIAAGQVTVVLCLKDERPKLPWLFEHYRNAGITRFLAIDNASNDGSTDWLRQQQDTHVFLARGSYSGSQHGTHWVNAVLDAHLADRWALVIDADEVLVYPLSEHLGLPALCRQLDAWGADLMFAFMLDCYGPEAIGAAPYKEGTPFWTANPFFDPQPYVVRARPGQSPPFSIGGGARHRCFNWEGAAGGPPRLRKVPLVKWSPSDTFLGSTHQTSHKTLAPMTGALLHYKFLDSFEHRVRTDAARPDRPDAAGHYDSYLAGLDAGHLRLHNTDSARYTSSNQLIALGLLGLPRRAAADWFGQLKDAGLPHATRSAVWTSLKAAIETQHAQFEPQLGHLLQLFHLIDPKDGFKF